MLSIEGRFSADYYWIVLDKYLRLTLQVLMVVAGTVRLNHISLTIVVRASTLPSNRQRF